MKNPEIKPARIGTVSHATLKTEDLIYAFTQELEWQINRNADYYQSSDKARDERQSLLDILRDAREYDEEKALESGDYETGDEIVQSLIDALNEFSGPYRYFGSHEGDGSDFGYWIDWEYINDAASSGDILLLQDDEDENIPEDYTGDAIVINDHGNTSGYKVQNGVVSQIYFDAV